VAVAELRRGVRLAHRRPRPRRAARRPQALSRWARVLVVVCLKKRVLVIAKSCSPCTVDQTFQFSSSRQGSVSGFTIMGSHTIVDARTVVSYATSETSSLSTRSGCSAGGSDSASQRHRSAAAPS
jgi:hypothetical protein